MSTPETAEWYYVGHYGQLGPLTLSNIGELAADGVIESDTYVWRPGLPDWQPAESVPELANSFARPMTPPPPPAPRPGIAARSAPAPASMTMPYGTDHWLTQSFSIPSSDKNRLAAGFLNILPGMGRFYLGYTAHGILQFMTCFCGFGFLWSWIDGIYILAGGVKQDGYGRELPD